jgi:serine/threonine-protein kinase
MHEGAREEGDRNKERRLARLRALEAERDEALLAALPAVGTVVEGLVLEALLGQGGYGTVYLARRDGQTVAVKFIYLPQAAGWALRELGALVRLETVGGVGLRGHGLWPPDKPVFQFIVMEYVDGWELYTWARHHNPHALEVVDVLLDLAQELAAAHSVGVVHRDLKGDNVLVRAADGRALLVDFGVATWPEAPRMTGPQVPGCREYLSPEVVRFNRGEREHHQASGLDDLWALGVVAYQLLTGTSPFQGRNAVETERAILHEAPQPPHVRNPRVPRALSQVCLRLLEKEPGARYPDARALHAALQEVKRGADEKWKVPLCEAWGPDAAPTRAEVALVTEERVKRLERLLEYERRHPRRGEPWPDKQVHAPASAAEAASPAAGEQRVDAEDSRLPWLVLVAGLGLVLMGGLLAELSSLAVQRARVPALSPVGTPRADPPLESFPIALEPIGQEVAFPWRPLEGGASAAPSGASTPAPVASATLPQDMRVKTPRKTFLPQDSTRRPRDTGSPATKAGAALVLCTLASGCPGPTAPQVRPLPPPAECPPGAVQAMKELGFTFGKSRTALFPREDETTVWTPIRVGPGVTMELDQTGTKLPNGTVVSGELYFGEGRLHGRFTQAHTPQGQAYPVCLVLVDRNSNIGLGADNVRPGKEPGTVLVVDSEGVRAVERFE